MSESPEAKTTPVSLVQAIHDADTQYQPFPSFAEWSAGLQLDEVRRRRIVDRLHALRDTPVEALQRAEQTVRRAAAIDTGAIEGLSETDRGFTVTVATEAAMWQAAFEKKGKDTRDLIQAQMDAYELAFDVATKKEPITEARIFRSGWRWRP